MASCAWPRGCQQEQASASLDAMCYYHSKVVTGLIGPDRALFASHSRLPDEEHKGNLVSMLERLGSAPAVLKAVVSVPMHPDHHVRHGVGYVPHGRLRMPS